MPIRLRQAQPIRRQRVAPPLRGGHEEGTLERDRKPGHAAEANAGRSSTAGVDDASSTSCREDNHLLAAQEFIRGAKPTGILDSMNIQSFSVLGAVPDAVLEPSSSAHMCELVRSTAGALAPWGGGTAQHIGYPIDGPFTAVSTHKLDSVVEYRPQDLTVTVQAGMRVEQVQEALAAHSQRLPFEVALPHLRTIGGVVATRAHSVTRLQSGTVRDAVLGIDVVNGRGELIRAGGRVVKNVSGYDLPKLYCGSWGTLGLISEVTFRVVSRPEATALVLLPMNADHNTEDMLDFLLSGKLQPSYVALLNPLAARRALEMPDDEPDRQFIAVRFAGLTEDVDWQVTALPEPRIVLPEPAATVLHVWLRDFPFWEPQDSRDSHSPGSGPPLLGRGGLDFAKRADALENENRPLPSGGTRGWDSGAPMTAAFHIMSSQVGAFSRMVEWTARKAGFDAVVMTESGSGVMRAHFQPNPESGSALLGPNGSEKTSWAAIYADLSDKAARCGGSFVIERMPQVLRDDDVPVWFPVLPDFTLMRSMKAKLDPARSWNPGRFVGRI